MSATCVYVCMCVLLCLQLDYFEDERSSEKANRSQNMVSQTLRTHYFVR